MNPSIESLANRLLREVSRFNMAISVAAWPLLEGENILGMYENDAAEKVGITNLGLRPSKTCLIRYSEITGANIDDQKHEADAGLTPKNWT